MHTFTRYVVVGAGGIGHFLAPVLARFLAYAQPGAELVIIDGDSVEDKNLGRVYGPRAVGENKAELLAGMCADIVESGRLTVVSISQFITPDTYYRYFRDVFTNNTIVFGCVDNNVTRCYLESLLVNKNDVALVLGGNDYLTGQAQFWTKRDGVETPRITHFAPELTDEDTPGNFFPDDPNCTEEYESEPQLVLTNNAIATAMVNLYYSQVIHKAALINEVLVRVPENIQIPNNRRSLKPEKINV